VQWSVVSPGSDAWDQLRGRGHRLCKEESTKSFHGLNTYKWRLVSTLIMSSLWKKVNIFSLIGAVPNLVGPLSHGTSCPYLNPGLTFSLIVFYSISIISIGFILHIFISRIQAISGLFLQYWPSFVVLFHTHFAIISPSFHLCQFYFIWLVSVYE